MPFLAWTAVSSPPTGAAGGDLGGTYPSPTVTGTHLGAALPIAQGGTGQATAAAALTALAGAQTAGRYARSDGTNTALAAIAAGDVPTLNQNTTGTSSNITGTLDQVPAPAANVAMNSKKFTGMANGVAASDGAAFGQIPALPVSVANGGTGAATAVAGQNALGGLAVQASTGTAGYTLVNGTGNIVTWTAPNDGALHYFDVTAVLHVTTLEVGGSIQVTWTAPDGTSTTTSIFAGSQSGVQSVSQRKICQAGTAVTVAQNTALTSGAAVAWVSLWGL